MGPRRAPHPATTARAKSLTTGALEDDECSVGFLIKPGIKHMVQHY